MQEFRENDLKAVLVHALVEICDPLNTTKFDTFSFFTEVHMNFLLILTSNDSKPVNTKWHQELGVSVRAREGSEPHLQLQYHICLMQV